MYVKCLFQYLIHDRVSWNCSYFVAIAAIIVIVLVVIAASYSYDLENKNIAEC